MTTGILYVPDELHFPEETPETHDEFMARLTEILSTALIPYTGECRCPCHDPAFIGHHWGINECCHYPERKRA